MKLGALLFIVVYLLVLGALGWFAERRRKAPLSIEEFFIASGQIGPLHSFLTALATGFSAFTFLGAVGLAYDLGFDGLVLAGGAMVFTVPTVVLVGKRLWALGKQRGYVTPADFLADRFPSHLVRLLVAAIAVVFAFFYVQVQLVGTGYIIDVLTGDLVSYEMAVVIMAALMLFYVTLGGMRAVVWTDAVQAVLLVGGMLVIAGYVLSQQGLIREGAEAQANVYSSELPTLYLWTVAVGYGLSVAVWPQYYVRYFAARDRKGVFSIGIANDIGSILLLTFLIAMIGFAGVALFPNVAPDTVTVQFIQALPLVLAWPMAAAGTAAAQSTADSILLTSSSIGTKDIYVRYSRRATGGSRDARLVARGLTAVLTVVAMVAALQPPELILRYVLDLSYPGFLLLLPPTVAGLFWRRATTAGAVAGMLGGLVTIALTTFTWPDALNIYPGIWGLVVNCVLLVAVSLVTSRVDAQRVEQIHGFLDSVDYDAIETDSVARAREADLGAASR